MAAAGAPSVEAARQHFPALKSSWALMENAGGSQVPQCVADAIRDYMLTQYVQLGAGYPMSDQSTALVKEAHEFLSTFVNADGVGKIVIGASASQLVETLAHAFIPLLNEGDEIIVSDNAHEANVGPWRRVAKLTGAVIKEWRTDPKSLEACPMEGLRALLCERTRLVAVPHVSNILGEVVDLKAVTDVCHAAGALVVADGVAFAPHRAIDVKAWGVDFYFYSVYKVMGPHMAVLYGSDAAFAPLEGPNHFFVPKEDITYKFELGGVNHEGCAGILALRKYLRFLAGAGEDDAVDRAMVERAWAVMQGFEQEPMKRLLSYLDSKPQWKVFGPVDPTIRVPTIAFLHESKSAVEVVEAAHAAQVAIRNGHMYCYRICENLGIDPAQGFVRVSMIHYNTVDEVDRLIAVLDQL